MTKVYIKICGVKDIKIAEHAINCGASFLGFVFFENGLAIVGMSPICMDIASGDAGPGPWPGPGPGQAGPLASTGRMSMHMSSVIHRR